MANVSSSNGLEKYPKLRFPGFKEPWVTKQFSDVFSFLSNNTLSRADLVSSGDIHNIHYGDVLIKYGSIIDVEYDDIPCIVHGRESKGAPYLCDGDVIIADTAEDETVGKCCEIINTTDAKVESGLHTIPCRPMLTFAPMFLGYYMNSYYYHKQLFPLMQGVKVLSISKGNIAGTPISLPNSYSEQKKIVDLLRLIDTRIRKQQQIIEILKKYKRGVVSTILSHQIKFSDTAGKPFPEWTSCTLQDVVEFLDGQRKPLESADRAKRQGQYPYYGASGIIDYIDDFIFDEQLLLLGEDGANILNRSTPLCFIATGIYWVNNHAHVMRPKAEQNIKFLCELLESLDYTRYNTGTAQPKLNQEKCRGIELTLPIYEEQCRIADFLSSLDQKIKQEQVYLDCLFLLKNGMMQRLFI